MAQYIHLFNTASEFNEAYNGSSYEEPWVSYTEEDQEVHYNKIPIVPLTFEVLSSGTINFGNYQMENETTIEYRKNGGEWTEIQSSPMGTDWQTNLYTGGTEIQVNSGDIVCFRGSNETYCNEEWAFYGFCPSTCVFNLKGNIMSLLGGEKDTLESVYTFYSMFYGCEGLIDAHGLSLPATTLSEGCYMSLFERCSKLMSVPELPATTLASECYSYMFEGCTGLTQAPVLLTTTLASSCYTYMFQNCTSLTTAPALPATTLADSCYYGMFQNCTSLTTAPELPATTLTNGCYNSMFDWCSSLTLIKCLATDITANNCTSKWVNGVASTGTFITPSSTQWSRDKDGIPAGWTVINA